MTEVKPIDLDEIYGSLSEEDIEKIELGSENAVHMAEMFFALAVDTCMTTKNHASSVFQGKDDRLIVVTAQYTDGITLTQMYAVLEESKKMLEETFAQLVEQHRHLRKAAKRVASWFEDPDSSPATGELANRTYPVAFLDDLEHLKAIASRLYVANPPPENVE